MSNRKRCKKRFDVIENKVQNARPNNLHTRPNNCGSFVTINESNNLLQAIKDGEITYEEALNKMTNIRGVIKRFDNLDFFYQNQAKVLLTTRYYKHV